MARPFKLNDLQLVLLSTAAQRADGSLLPPPDTIRESTSRIRKVISPLLKQALIEEVTVTEATASWRTDVDRHIGAVITSAGRAAVGSQAAVQSEAVAPMIAAHAPPASKIATVLAMMKRNDGATLPELVEATGWQAHTTRAALTGLRRKGHQLDKRKRGDVTCYHVAA